ncbi:elongation factor 1-beta [Arthroderma uncinatum]|uniref:elongation factor 1-beta n=1 Tax=Arthroderma uncinatum TaxID=74035 RepID=UPI00144A7016|nr:elongation factor 1-beta [Arthroderma uncinatum]KAF3480175.1 elongation factor 1-beta [Arthroderma uncinatum]
MGFTDFSSDSGLAIADSFFSRRTYVEGYEPSQADVVTFKAFKSEPDAAKYPHVARWYRHAGSFEQEFSTLPGDASKEYTAYGPDSSELPINPKSAPAAAAADEDDDDEDLFGSDDEDPEVVAERERNLAAYKAKKANKPKPAAKSIVTLDVKPWDDETNMAELEAGVRKIEHDGLVWAGSQLVAVGFGIKKLQINLVIEDEKISVTDLQEEIEELQDYVQSTDVAAMQKL